MSCRISPVRSCLSTPSACGREVMEQLRVFWGVYLSDSAALRQPHGSGISVTGEKGLFPHIWADWVTSLSAEDMHTISFSYCLSNTRKYFMNREQETIKFIACDCEGVVSTASLMALISPSGTWTLWPLGPAVIHGTVAWDLWGTGQELGALGSFYKQAVSPAPCQDISCLARLSPKLIT